MAKTTRIEDLLADLAAQARITNRLLAAQLKSSMKQTDLVELLSTTGASVKDIALILGTSPATVATTRLRLRRGRPERRNARAGS